MLDENEEYFSDWFDAVGYYMDRMSLGDYDDHYGCGCSNPYCQV